MKKIDGGVTAAIGFKAAGGSVGIKKENVKEEPKNEKTKDKR